VALYSRRQVALLLLLTGTAGLGLAVGRWRRAHPDLAERLESFDHAPRSAAAPAVEDAAPARRRRRRADARTARPGPLLPVDD
jgi:hypothetical protein